MLFQIVSQVIIKKIKKIVSLVFMLVDKLK